MFDLETQTLTNKISEVAQDSEYLRFKSDLSEFINYKGDRDSLAFTVLKIKLEQSSHILLKIRSKIKECGEIISKIKSNEKNECFLNESQRLVHLLNEDLNYITSVILSKTKVR